MAAVAGIALPLVWFGLLFAAGAQRPGYDHVRQFMTELTVGPGSSLVLAAALLGGALFAVFAAGLFDALGRDRIALAIAVLVATKGGATALTGLILGDVDPLVRTPSGQLHNASIAVGNVALAVACALAARPLLARGRRALAGYSAATAAVLLVLLVVLATLTTGGTARADAPLAAWGGLVQRLSMLAGVLWPAVVGWRVMRVEP